MTQYQNFKYLKREYFLTLRQGLIPHLISLSNELHDIDRKFIKLEVMDFKSSMIECFNKFRK